MCTASVIDVVDTVWCKLCDCCDGRYQPASRHYRCLKQEWAVCEAMVVAMAERVCGGNVPATTCNRHSRCWYWWPHGLEIQKPSLWRSRCQHPPFLRVQSFPSNFDRYDLGLDPAR